MIYKITKSLTTGFENGIVLLQDNINPIYIPNDPDNTDYQTYLKWLEEGNTPEPAEETK